MGYGDIRLGALIALALGWIAWRYAFIGFFAANLVGALFGVALIAARRGGLKTKVPFGVFLAIGAVLAIAFGSAIHYPA